VVVVMMTRMGLGTKAREEALEEVQETIHTVQEAEAVADKALEDLAPVVTIPMDLEVKVVVDKVVKVVEMIHTDLETKALEDSEETQETTHTDQAIRAVAKEGMEGQEAIMTTTKQRNIQ